MIDQRGQDSLISLKHDLRGECELGYARAKSTNEFDMYEGKMSNMDQDHVKHCWKHESNLSLG